MAFNAPASLTWSSATKGFMGNDAIVSDVTWRDFKDKSTKCCFKDSSEPALFHMYVRGSPRNIAVSPSGSYNKNFQKKTNEETIKAITQSFFGIQPWGPNALIGKPFPACIANLQKIQGLISAKLENRHLLYNEGTGDMVRFSNKPFSKVCISSFRPHKTLIMIPLNNF
jgi:hypothetical protein